MNDGMITIIFLRQQRNYMILITLAKRKENQRSSQDETKIAANAFIPMLADKERLSGKAPVCINIENFIIATNVSTCFT